MSLYPFVPAHFTESLLASLQNPYTAFQRNSYFLIPFLVYNFIVNVSTTLGSVFIPFSQVFPGIFKSAHLSLLDGGSSSILSFDLLYTKQYQIFHQ